MSTVPLRKEPTKLRARLGETLRKLQASLERSRQQEEESLLQFVAWQAQWTTRRDMIAKRLTQIDGELSRLQEGPAAGSQFPPGPQLSVVAGTVPHQGEVLSMGPR